MFTLTFKLALVLKSFPVPDLVAMTARSRKLSAMKDEAEGEEETESLFGTVVLLLVIVLLGWKVTITVETEVKPIKSPSSVEEV